MYLHISTNVILKCSVVSFQFQKKFSRSSKNFSRRRHHHHHHQSVYHILWLTNCLHWVASIRIFFWLRSHLYEKAATRLSRPLYQTRLSRVGQFWYVIFHGTRPITAHDLWRSLICRKYGGQGQSGQTIKLFQAPRKISFTSHFWYTPTILDDMKLAELSNDSFDSARMWHFYILGESKHTDPSYIFSGGQVDAQPAGSTPLINRTSAASVPLDVIWKKNVFIHLPEQLL